MSSSGTGGEEGRAILGRGGVGGGSWIGMYVCRFLIQLVNGLALVIARQTDERLYCIQN